MPRKVAKRYLKLSATGRKARCSQRQSEREAAADTEPPAPPAELLATPSTSASTSVATPSTSAAVPEPNSSRAKRMKVVESEEEEADIYDQKYLLSHSQLDALVKGLKCSDMKCRAALKISVDCERATGDVKVVCRGCSKVRVDSPAPRQDDLCEANLILVYKSLMNGTGMAGLNRIAGFVGEPFTCRSYSRHCNYLFDKMDAFYKEGMAECHNKVRDYYLERGVETDENGALSIEVSCDGTWMTRGHKSHIGAAFCIEIETGLVVDVEVLSNYCWSCTTHPGRNHKCHVNFDGKSGAMEAECAVRMWGRSQSNKLVYKTFVGDGDSSAYTAVCAMNGGLGPYDTPVVKEECVNHVSKRLGTRLRKMKKETSEVVTGKTGKARKKTVMGGRNMLTDPVIDKLSSYFGKAIRDNVGSDCETMKKAIWSSYYHLTSTDDDPCHHFCPQGETSWCFYQRAKAKGDTPEPHDSKNLFLAKIPYEKLHHVRSVYNDLTTGELLRRCLKGATQNKNESIHQKLWATCEKRKFAAIRRVTFCAQAITLQHNFGYGKSLLRHLFGFSAEIGKQISTRECEAQRMSNRRKVKSRKVLTFDEGYNPGGH